MSQLRSQVELPAQCLSLVLRQPEPQLLPHWLLPAQMLPVLHPPQGRALLQPVLLLVLLPVLLPAWGL